MPTYQRFEDLPAWQAAARLYDGIDAFLGRTPPRVRPGFRDQLECAALAVSNHIAEGFERGTTNELLSFLDMARGSAGEVRSMLILAGRLPRLAKFKFEISDLKLLAESCSRQLRAWADSLQNSDLAGPRQLNEPARKGYDERQARVIGAAHFQQMLARHLPADHPLHSQTGAQPG